MEEYRKNKILGMIPSEIKTVLDIGSAGNVFAKKFDTTTIDLIEDADIKQDLNKNQKLKLKSNSFDIVILNQILEHLDYLEEIIEEAKRVSKRFLLIGLPNELTLGHRIRFLLGRPSWKGYRPFWHKHFFTIDESEKFILNFFNGYEKKEYWFYAVGNNFLPRFFKNFLANHLPRLFAKEVYYLVDIKKIRGRKSRK